MQNNTERRTRCGFTKQGKDGQMFASVPPYLYWIAIDHLHLVNYDRSAMTGRNRLPCRPTPYKVATRVQKPVEHGSEKRVFDYVCALVNKDIVGNTRQHAGWPKKGVCAVRQKRWYMAYERIACSGGSPTSWIRGTPKRIGGDSTSVNVAFIIYCIARVALHGQVSGRSTRRNRSIYLFIIYLLPLSTELNRLADCLIDAPNFDYYVLLWPPPEASRHLPTPLKFQRPTLTIAAESVSQITYVNAPGRPWAVFPLL